MSSLAVQVDKRAPPGQSQLVSPTTAEESSSSSWGDQHNAKQDDVIRVGFWNCGGLPQNNSDGKNIQIRELINVNKFDIFGLSEVNLHWKLINTSQQLRERTLFWFETLHISTSYLRSWPFPSKFQVGGTTLWSINSCAHRVLQSGSDDRQMGRWSWTTYRGKNGIILRIICAYRCAANHTGPLSAWSQQKLLLEQLQIDTDPRTQFCNDLIAHIVEWCEQGNQIILGLDLNESVVTSEFTARLFDLGIHELPTTKHGHPPPTYNRGSTPIDGIYVSANLRHSKCGYLPFVGDHRPLWIDVSLQVAFGTSTAIPTPIRARRLQLNNPRTVDRYLEHYATFIQNNNFINKLENIELAFNRGHESTAVSLYNELDKLREQGMKTAEQQCRKLKMGEIPFTPEYTNLAQAVLFWKLVKRYRSGRSVDSKYFKRQLKKMNIMRSAIHSLTIDQINGNIRLAYQTLNQYSKRADIARSKWIDEVCAAKAIKSGLSVEQEIKTMYLHEQQRRDARLIKKTIKPTESFGLPYIQHTFDGRTYDITDKSQMEDGLLKELEIRFSQAAATPFASPPLLDSVGPIGLSYWSEQILTGTFIVPENTDQWTRKILKELKYIPDYQKVQQEFNKEITPTIHSQGWKKMKEQTAAGLSGISFAQFKANAIHPDIAYTDSKFAELPFQQGFSPARWQQGINVMLLKKPGNYHPDKLRAIILYEADFNQNNKYLGKQIMNLAEKYNGLAIEQFGSRKNMSSIDQSLNKLLTYDIWRQFKTRGALCSNDAKSCYDRIVHNFASLALQRIGIPTQPIQSMFTTIQHMNHHVRTSHGVSNKAFSGEHWPIPIHGVGQGNGAGPQIWAAVSTPILNMVRNEGCGARFQSSITNTECHFVGYAFVDDTDLVTYNTTITSNMELNLRMQHALDAWEGGIRASGGAIVPEKCHWYLIDFEWHQGKAKYKEKQTISSHLFVNDHNGNRVEIKQLNYNEAERTLGVRLAPDGNMNSQFNYMKEKIIEWGESIRSGCLSRRLVQQALNSTIIKTLTYALPSTTLSEQQCKQLTSTLLAYALPKMGYVRTFPRKLVFGNYNQFGLQLPNLYWIQGIDHIDRLLRYNKSNHLTGQLLRQSMEAARLELGCNGSLFQLSYPTYACLLSSCWIKQTWEFLYKTNITLHIEVPELVSPRKDDRLLIPIFVSFKYSESQLLMLNNCRMYLQVCYISDITTACGKYISKRVWDGQLAIDRTPRYNWPVIPKPPSQYWKLWKLALAQLCSRFLRLHQPVGPWISSQHVRFLFDPQTERLFQKTEHGYLVHIPVPGRPSRTASYRFGPGITTTSSPHNWHPASVEKQGLFFKLTGIGQLISEPRAIQMSNLMQFIPNAVPPECAYVFKQFHMHGNLTQFVTNLYKKLPIIAVSDGSYKEDFGTASWIILFPDNPLNYLTGSVVVPGPSWAQSAYRSELFGLYCISLSMYAISKFLNSGIDITIGCDGLTALESCQFIQQDHINPNIAHFDLIFAIRAILRQYHANITFKHIKGHQDDNPDASLDLWAKLNIQMDANAKEMWLQEFPAYTTDSAIYLEPGYVQLCGEKIPTQLRKRILYFLSVEASTGFWKDKGLKTDDIDWESIGHALQSLSPARRQWTVKFASGFCGTGVMMKHWNQQDSDLCARCLTQQESRNHIFLCRDEEVNVIWSRHFNILQEWMVSTSTHPEIAPIITSRLNSLYNTAPTQPWSPLDSNLQEAISFHDSTGWHWFLLGFISHHWKTTQLRYLQSLNSKTIVKRWTTAFIRKLWDISWDCWESRNKRIHDNDESILIQTVNAQIQAEFSQGFHRFPTQARALTQPGIDKILQYKLQSKQHWIARIQSTRSRITNNFSNEVQGQRNFMRQWLQRS